MKLFFVDDSNIAKEKYLSFFIYGGIIVDGNTIRDLIKCFLKIKLDHNIDPNIEIKWDNINNLDPTEAKTFKNDILKLVKISDCKIIVYLAPQDFYHSVRSKIQKGKLSIKSRIDPDKYIRSLKYATNVCMQKFNQYLEEINDIGLILADESSSYKKEMVGYYSSLYPKGTEMTQLNRIVYTIIPIDSCYSQMHQVNDIVIGAIQHSLKEFKYNFLPLLKDNFWLKKIPSKRLNQVNGYGFNVYPKKAKTLKMQKMLKILSEKFKRLINKKI